ncbi:hypothetical protein CRE_13425 [Caenorhabditis remanei]|uniref:Uncharacterized protein n=1 Tax=Caenorhabditis remanei TaxID=31234 RepID=E3M8A8_CAERE|nr:hypothetical protein CRE_13425 [Caenorhabditis remanei]
MRCPFSLFQACQILLPIGICKQICHPHHIGTVNANYAQKGQKQDVKPGTKDNRYPEDVTFPPSDIEKVYDIMGDEDARKSKTLTLVSLEEGSIEEKAPPVKENENEKKKPTVTPTVPAPRTPPNHARLPSREILLTPKQSLKTANEGTRKTTSMETIGPATTKGTPSREQLTPINNGSGGARRGRSREMIGPPGDDVIRRPNGTPSREQTSGSVERRTPSKETNSKKVSALYCTPKSEFLQANPPKMGTAEPI